MVSLEENLSGILAVRIQQLKYFFSFFFLLWVNQACHLHIFLFLLHPSRMVSAVILPTIWRYLQILEAPPYFLGLGLSAFSLSGLLTGPIFGFWSDRSKTTKSIILFSNLFEIAGESPNHKTSHDAESQILEGLDITCLNR